MQKDPIYPNQVIPLGLTTVVCGFGIIFLYLVIHLLNLTVVNRAAIITHFRIGDILVGITVYLKTSIDFAILIGRLMHKYPGWKNRIMIEIGTALGNIAGTLAILILWDLFREIKLLMAVMIILAAMVLLRMAEDGFEHVKDEEGNYKVNFWGLERLLEKSLHKINGFFAPFLKRLVPDFSLKEEDTNKTLKGLFLMSLTIPFILGLDDFAGYIPLFNIVNVFGFAAGVFLGHMFLNIALFISPETTTHAVKHPYISFAGSVAFIGLAGWGVFEAIRLIGLIH